MKKFTAVAMKCNQEQFDAIRPKLEQKGFKISCISDFIACSYLTNNWGRPKVISNIVEDSKNYWENISYDEWNEEIFLNACGIETVKTYELTAEQIRKLANNNSWCEKFLKNLYPDAFEVKYKENKWITPLNKYEGEAVFFITDFKNNDGYGINFKNEYVEGLDCALWKIEFRDATEKEVSEALIKEAKNRGLWDCHFINLYGEKAKYENYVAGFDFKNNILYSKYGGIFDNGKWATPINVTEVTQKELIKFYKKEKGIDNLKVVVK